VQVAWAGLAKGDKRSCGGMAAAKREAEMMVVRSGQRRARYALDKTRWHGHQMRWIIGTMGRAEKRWRCCDEDHRGGV
jgi:hypothetical protein